MTNVKFNSPDGVKSRNHSETEPKDGTYGILAEQEKSPTTVAEQVTPAVRFVPPGLFRCPVCSEYRGFIEIDDQSAHSRCNGDFLTVQCICDGIPCPRCGVNRIRRPISNVWTERGGFGHVPYFAAWFGCKECCAKREAENADRESLTRPRDTNKEPTKEESK